MTIENLPGERNLLIEQWTDGQQIAGGRIQVANRRIYPKWVTDRWGYDDSTYPRGFRTFLRIRHAAIFDSAGTTDAAQELVSVDERGTRLAIQMNERRGSQYYPIVPGVQFVGITIKDCPANYYHYISRRRRNGMYLNQFIFDHYSDLIHTTSQGHLYGPVIRFHFTKI